MVVGGLSARPRPGGACENGGMGSLGSVIEAGGLGGLEAEVFGATDASTVAEVLSSIVVAATGERVASGLWYRSSVAAVAGVRLNGGGEAVVRAYQPSVSGEFLGGVVRVQSHLAEVGFACARPLGEPVVVDGVLGRVASMLADPGQRRFASSEMWVSAQGLAQLVALAAGLDPTGLERHPMALPDGGLYPAPHSPLFDFEATVAGAEWIDEIATAARSAMTDGSSVIAHGDWSARNVRLGTDGLACVFDWESLQSGPETMAVGVAAATWQALGEAGEPMAPSGPEILRYLDCYEQARPGGLSDGQRRSACAAAVFALAYTARCEHALRPGIRDGRASGRLAQDDGLRSLIS